MRTRNDHQKYEMETLSPYAAKSGQSMGRTYPEEEHPYRTCFQRDRDRVLHSSAFRRLEYKTQVFVYHEGDHYRTRLTHTLEGAQIARTISRTLGLNEDLAEAITLAHDLGHTPFGHSGETILNQCMKEYGGFEHNRQSLRIVDLLEERYSDFPGLNLTYEVREGIAKHQSSYDKPNPQASFERKGRPSLEAQIVNYADEIAYTNHDLDDGISSGLLSLTSLDQIELWKKHFSFSKSDELKIRCRETIRRIINDHVTSLITQILQNIETHEIRTYEDVRACPETMVHYPPLFEKQNRELKRFLRENMYHHYRVERMAEKAHQIITLLFERYMKNKKILPPSVITRKEKLDLPVERAICDYIAGMTDRFAIEEYNRLFDVGLKV